LDGVTWIGFVGDGGYILSFTNSLVIQGEYQNLIPNLFGEMKHASDDMVFM
jgi:hypothetical protein